MKVTFFSNFLNHHQTPFCDEMYHHLGKEFTFVSTEETPRSFLMNGYPDCTNYVYNLLSYSNKVNFDKALQLALISDIVISGSSPEIFIRERIKKNKHTFRYSERLFRRWNGQLLDPNFFLALLRLHTVYRNKNLYMLCSGGYTANDFNLIYAYPNKKFKWGYFTKVEEIDIEKIVEQKPRKTIEILWTARFIPLKHPELAVNLAYELKNRGYDFHLIMIGSGELENEIDHLIKKKHLQNHVQLLGSMLNSEVLNFMKRANIFLFTSNRQEGWGAVLNEAMSCGCAVVASHSIGAVPFLIEHQTNGLIYKSGNLPSLLHQTEMLINNKPFMDELGINAYYTLRNEWSPKKAAFNFLKLAESLLEGRTHFFNSGPCSRATNTKLIVNN